jgi:transposase-like protein
VALGVTCAGERDILGLWASDGGEGAKFWLAVLTEIKNRGSTDVCIVVGDGLKGLPEAVSAVWDRAIIQACVIHLLRNIFRYASRKYWEQIAKDIRPVYTAPTEAAAKERFVEFTAKWGAQYPAIIRLWENAWSEVRAVPRLRRGDPPRHLFDKCSGIDQRPLPPRDPCPRAFPDRTSCPEMSLPGDPIAGSDRER